MTTLSKFTLKICKFLDTFLRVSVNQGTGRTIRGPLGTSLEQPPGTTPWNGVESKNKKNEILKNQNNYKIIVSLRTFKTSPLLML